MDERPKIEVVRVSSTERRNFRPLDGVQLRAAYSHVRVGTYCPEIETENETTIMCENKPPVGGLQSRKFKKNLGPVSRLLRRRHQGTCLATKSCDNIYNVNRNSNSLDWRMGQSATEPALQARQSSSLDWRLSRNVNNPDWRNSSRSAEQLSQSPNFTPAGIHTPSAKSKIVSLLRRLSPRLSRNNVKTTGPTMPSSPTICPWIRVEYSNESMNDTIRRQDSQDSDVSYQRELQLNELRKRMLGCAAAASPSSPLGSYSFASRPRIDNGSRDENANTGSSKNVENYEEKIFIFDPRVNRAIHEDRHTGKDKLDSVKTENKGITEIRRIRPRRGPGHGEVAGLEENDDTTLNSDVKVVKRQLIRPRTLSLAVKTLNYQLIDQDNFTRNENNNDDDDVNNEDETIVSRKCGKQHPNMTSQESIGNCSLDVDRSASDRSEATLDSVSDRTLHSLNLSCNGQAASPSSSSSSPRENFSNCSSETLQKQKQQQQQQQQGPILQIERVNGEKCNAEIEQLTSAKKPSYLGLACSISGYSGITRYDSKLREGFRSRDSSPGSRLITRETSPAGFRSSENLGVPGPCKHPTKSQSISPLAMDRHNGFSNGAKDCKIEKFVDNRETINLCQDYSEVDRGINQLSTNFADISPIRSTSPIKITSGTMQITSSFSRETRNYASSISVSSPRIGHTVSKNSFSETSFVNGSSLENTDNQTSLNNSSCSEKSFIQQRVERLYGPGALAQGFFFKRTNQNTPDNSFNKSNSGVNFNDRTNDNANTEESLKNLPVLRHLRPEFRAQLPVVSPRKATDGTEQVIKPLQRISLTPQRKNETNLKISSSNIGCNVRENESVKLSASVTSIPDQQPAAPEVVLPVIETVPTSASSIDDDEKIIKPDVNSIEEKHGHHFMSLLNAERDRLLILAESAEAELANADPATLPEEAEGKLRSAAGKARLLAKQKMQQFEGLCHKNISQIPGEKFPTTYEDLAGFWDMVMLQVVQVNDIFAEIDKLKSSQWQEITTDENLSVGTSQNGNSTKRRLIVTKRPKTTATSEAYRKAREAREQARRKMMEDRRRAIRSNAQKEDDGVTIFAPET